MFNKIKFNNKKAFFFNVAKKSIFLFLAFASNTISAQIKINTKIPVSKNIQKNLFDAVPGYRINPIAFVPFIAGADAVKRGFKADSIYKWTDPAGKKHSASGTQILQQVNEVEKSLCERGHSFRHKNTFDGMVAKIPQNVLLEGIPNLPENFYPTKNKNLKPTKFNKDYNKFKNIAGTIYPYMGYAVNKGEFAGMLSDGYFLARLPNDASTLTFPLNFATSQNVINLIGNCTIELYKNAAKTGMPILSFPIDVTKNILSVALDSRNKIETQNPVPNSNGVQLYNYNVQFKNFKNVIKSATREDDLYYLNFKFTDKSGKPIIISIQNDIILNNSLGARLNISSNSTASINKFDFSVTDPVSHTFGLYANSNGFNATTSNAPFGNYGEDRKSALSANLSVGATYYNFWHLLNNDEPKTKNFEIVGFDFSSSQNYYKADRLLGIRVPGAKPAKNIFENPTTKFQFRVLNKVVNNAVKPFDDQVLFNERFFIGPVPCRATITLKGEAGIVVSGSSTEEKCDMKANITPYAKVNVVGEGGADAFIAYVLLVVDVNVLTVSMPIEMNIANNKAYSSSAIKVEGLKGKVYLKAGFCIPIPFFDDICKEFPIDIFSWSGLSETFNITESGSK